MSMANPIDVGTRHGSGVTGVKRDTGTPMSDRSIPKTSQSTPNSNGAKPGNTNTAT